MALKEAFIKNESDKLKITNKSLEQFDLLLRNKDENLRNEEKKLKEKMNLLIKEELDNEELKLKCIKYEQEIRMLKKQENNEGNHQAISEIDLIISENEKLKDLLAEKPSEFSFIDQLLTEKKTLTGEKIKFEQEKLELAQEKYIFQQGKLKTKEKNSENDKAIDDDAEYYENLNSNSYNSLGLATETHSKINFRIKELDYREIMLAQYEKEFNTSLFQVKEYIEMFNSELEEREMNLNNRENQIVLKEQRINERILELKQIECELESSQQEVADITQVIFPAFESYSQALSQLLADLYMKKQEIEGELSKFDDIFHNLSVQQTCIEEERMLAEEDYENKLNLINQKEKNVLEHENKNKEREQELSKILNEKITELSNDLEEKLRKIREKEYELEIIKTEVEKEREENTDVAKMLKITHLELENQKIKEYESIRNKKDKLRKLKQRLEEHLKLVQIKENELNNKII